MSAAAQRSHVWKPGEMGWVLTGPSQMGPQPWQQCLVGMFGKVNILLKGGVEDGGGRGS